MDINAAFPSSYLKSTDIGSNRISVTLGEVKMEEMPKGDVKPVLYFRGKDRGLVLNKTNATTLADAYGTNTDNWEGQLGVLFTIDTEFGGRRTKGIRIDVPHSEPAPLPVAPDGSVDDLPF